MSWSVTRCDELALLAYWNDDVLEFYRPWANAWIYVDPGGWHSRLPWAKESYE